MEKIKIGRYNYFREGLSELFDCLFVHNQQPDKFYFNKLLVMYKQPDKFYFNKLLVYKVG